MNELPCYNLHLYPNRLINSLAHFARETKSFALPSTYLRYIAYYLTP